MLSKSTEDFGALRADFTSFQSQNSSAAVPNPSNWLENHTGLLNWLHQCTLLFHVRAPASNLGTHNDTF